VPRALFGAQGALEGFEFACVFLGIDCRKSRADQLLYLFVFTQFRTENRFTLLLERL